MSLFSENFSVKSVCLFTFQKHRRAYCAHGGGSANLFGLSIFSVTRTPNRVNKNKIFLFAQDTGFAGFAFFIKIV